MKTQWDYTLALQHVSVSAFAAVLTSAFSLQPFNFSPSPDFSL